MKNFYELTGINTRNQLNIKVELKEHDTPTYNFWVNNIAIQPIFLYKADLLEPLTFNCIVTSGAIEVTKITINDNEIMPIYLHLADPKTNWITANWTFVIPSPFYPWYHEITGQGWIA